MKIKKILAVFMALALLLCGCGGGGSSTPSSSEEETAGSGEAVLQYGITTDPDHLDPFQATSADSRLVLFNLYEGLLKPSPDGKVVPALAESYKVSDDLKTYTFVLKDGIQFHNGETVKAEDVKYSLEQAMEYKLTGMDAIKSVKVEDEKTVSVTLKEADSEFYYNMTTAIIPNGYEDSNSQPIGTGPYKFESYQPQQELVMVKNENYWNPELPKNDKLVFKVKADLNTVLLDLQGGSLNAGQLDTTLVTQLNADDFDIVYANTNSVQMFCLNNSVKPLDNKQVRQAISYVVSADEIMELVHNGHAQRAASPVIPALGEGYDSSLDGSYAKNVEKAKELMAQAGYENGFSLTITVPSSYKSHVDAAQVIVNQLAEIGITATVKQIDWSTWLSDVYTNKDYETTVISVDGVTLSPRSYLYRYVSDEENNFIKYSNKEFDRLYKESLTETDANKRTEIYHQLQQILSEDAASVFLCDVSAPKVFKKGWSGFQPYPIYIFDASTISFQ